jgi:hypothetical protein
LIDTTIGAVTICWDPNSEEDLAGYRIYYKADSAGPPYNGIGSDKGPSPITTSLSGETGYKIENSDPVCFSLSLPGETENRDYCLVVTAYDTEGLESTFSNEVCLSGTTSDPPPPPILYISDNEFPKLIYFEGFENYDFGNDPANWYDSATGNSMIRDETLFKVFEVEGGKGFGTVSTATNIHSHYTGPAAEELQEYTFSGRMMIMDPDGGIGITILSRYPSSDAYYRLRRYAKSSFHIAPHGAAISGGTAGTGIIPQPNIWYRFKIQVADSGSRTEIKAKVWQDETMEPDSWKIDCWDSNDARLVFGTFGFWAMGPGAKYWDDLKVIKLR